MHSLSKSQDGYGHRHRMLILIFYVYDYGSYSALQALRRSVPRNVCAMPRSSSTWWTYVFLGPSTRRCKVERLWTDEVQCALELCLEADGGDRTSLIVNSVFVWRDSLDVCGQPLHHSSQNLTSVSQECGANRTCGRPSSSFCLSDFSIVHISAPYSSRTDLTRAL